MRVVEDNWDYKIDLSSLEKKTYVIYESNLRNVNVGIEKKLEEGFKIQKHIYKSDIGLNHDDEVKALIEKNKELRFQIDTKLEQLSQQQTQYESFKKDQKLLSQEIKEKHEAFLMAKKFYRKFLKIYLTIESRNGDRQTVFLQFFTEAKKDSENYSARFSRNTKTRCYQLLSTTPKLSILKELQVKLEETNDVPGALCIIRQAFMSMKLNKKH